MLNPIDRSKFSFNPLFESTLANIEDDLTIAISEMDAHMQIDRLDDGRIVFYIGDFQTLEDESEVFKMLQEIHRNNPDLTRISEIY